jgi:hypothetical protein
MAYDGPISYLPVPYGKVSWCSDVVSPFTARHLESGSREFEGLETPQLQAPVWEVVGHGYMVFDDVQTPTRKIHCVIAGKSKKADSCGKREYYVLLVSYCAVGERQVYERVGVGILQKSHIFLHEPLHPSARIQ